MATIVGGPADGCVQLNPGATGVSAEEEVRTIKEVGRLGICPENEEDPPIRFDPGQAAREFWVEVSLPRPEVEIAPGWGLVGKKAFLETGSTLDPLTDSTATPLGDLILRARSIYVVDWGDGTVQEYDIEGGSWPDGRITHLYQDSGVYPVTLEQVWTAEWRLGALPWQQIAATRTMDSGIPDFTVQQVQAVRDR